MNKKKVFIADDDPAICESMSMILEDEGYDVTTTTEGEVVSKITAALPDIILLDIWMSGVDGRDVCQHLKYEKKTKQIPVIMISANKDTEQIANNCGADGFLAKPFDMNDLLAIVKKYTSK